MADSQCHRRARPRAGRVARVAQKPHLTLDTGKRTLWGMKVKILRWISVAVLLGAAVFASVVPRADLPETAFNEADAPVNLVIPVRPSLSIAPPVVDPIAVLPTPRFHRAASFLPGATLPLSIMPRQRHRHSLQNLLCTLLI